MGNYRIETDITKIFSVLKQSYVPIFGDRSNGVEVHTLQRHIDELHQDGWHKNLHRRNTYNVPSSK